MEKRILSLVLMISMVVMLLPTTVFANANVIERTLDIVYNGPSKICVEQDFTFSYTIPDNYCSGYSFLYINFDDRKSISFNPKDVSSNGQTYTVTVTSEQLKLKVGNSSSCVVYMGADHNSGGEYGAGYIIVAIEIGHIDVNKDHVCDVETCKAMVGTCADADKDHKCDYGCGENFGTHEDADRNHICDYGCKEAICSGGTATCKDKAVCDYCGNEYGDYDSSIHAGGTEVRNAKDATCTEDGYTGDTYCKGCDTKLSSGKSVDKTGHNYESKVTKEATTTRTGIMTYTCKNCEDSYEEEIPKLQGTVLPTWQEWELIDKIVAANKKKDEPVETEPEVTEPVETEPEETEPTETEPEVTEPVAEPWSNPFADVSETDAFFEAVKFAYENGYMNGMSTDTFAPNESLTRGMLVTVLYRAAGSPIMDEANPFTDVADDAWYYNAVVWAKSIGLITGITETEFAPENEITREQLVTIFYRYANFLGYDVSVGEDTNILSYEDFADVAEYAIPAMQWACGAGLIDGADGNILPKDNATRALVAMVLLGFYA